MRTLLSNIFQILFQFHFFSPFYYRRRWAFKLSVCVRFKELNKRYTLHHICVVSLIEEKPQNILYTLSKDYKKKKCRIFFLL